MDVRLASDWRSPHRGGSSSSDRCVQGCQIPTYISAGRPGHAGKDGGGGCFWGNQEIDGRVKKVKNRLHGNKVEGECVCVCGGSRGERERETEVMTRSLGSGPADIHSHSGVAGARDAKPLVLVT
jgi:hypothetical protein